MPAGGHHVGQAEQARDEVRGRLIGGGHEGAVGLRDADQFGLTAVEAATVDAVELVPGAADRAGVVGGSESTDDELSWPYRVTASPTCSTMPQYSCPIARGSLTASMPGRATGPIRTRRRRRSARWRRSVRRSSGPAAPRNAHRRRRTGSFLAWSSLLVDRSRWPFAAGVCGSRATDPQEAGPFRFGRRPRPR